MKRAESTNFGADDYSNEGLRDNVIRNNNIGNGGEGSDSQISPAITDSQI